MTFLEKLDALKARTGDNNASLSRNSGIKYTTIDGLYKKGYSNMKLSTLIALSEYFHVSMDYLAKDYIDDESIDANESKPVVVDELTAKAKEYLNAFNSLTPQNRHVLLVLSSALLQDQAANPDSSGRDPEID